MVDNLSLDPWSRVSDSTRDAGAENAEGINPCTCWSSPTLGVWLKVSKI